MPLAANGILRRSIKLQGDAFDRHKDWLAFCPCGAPAAASEGRSTLRQCSALSVGLNIETDLRFCSDCNVQLVPRLAEARSEAGYFLVGGRGRRAAWAAARIMPFARLARV